MTDRQQRKRSGSYYTPTALVESLLGSTLNPLIEDRLRGDDPEQALLSLTVCDPACGAGVFLVAAAERIAHYVATVRTGNDPPPDEDVRAARRDIVQRGIYGVDLNPVAVDLTRLALAVAALAPDSPNPFLDHHIKHGNALIGATPALLAKGIPDEAFTPIEGDDTKVCAALRRQNAAERAAHQPREGTLF